MTTTYIAFLRGINVGGHQVKMDRLRELFGGLGFTKVRTYIQTGNVFFESDESDRAELAARIEQQLLRELGYAVPAFVRTVAELAACVEAAPFKDMEATEDTRHLILFLSAPLPAGLKLPLASARDEFTILAVTPGEAFVLLRRLQGKTGNVVQFIEKGFGVTASSRFYHTTLKILAAASAN